MSNIPQQLKKHQDGLKLMLKWHKYYQDNGNAVLADRWLVKAQAKERTIKRILEAIG